MNIAKHVLLPAAIGFAVAVPIAVNHDEAYLDHERSGATSVGGFLGRPPFALQMHARCSGTAPVHDEAPGRMPRASMIWA